MNVDNTGMDPTCRYYPGMDCLQEVGNSPDTFMTGMLEDGLLTDLENTPLVLDGFGKDYDPKPHASADPTISQAPMALPDYSEDASNEQLLSSSVDNEMMDFGAGPPLAAFGAMSATAGGGTLTEYTNKRDWSQLLMEGLSDLLHILTPDGRILHLSPNGEHLTGYPPEELVGKFIVDFVHPNDSDTFVREFNDSIASGNRLRSFYRFRMKDGTYAIFESHGHPHLTSDAAASGSRNMAGFCRGVFVVARPYPSKNTALLDSFLEHKIENIRLRKRIEALKREEVEEITGHQRKGVKQRDEKPGIAPHGTDIARVASVTTPVATTNLQTPSAMTMPPPAKPTGLNNALARKTLEDVSTSSRSNSANDQISHYEVISRAEAIEMLTGLRYQEGERSQGISTGSQNPTLIKGAAGIPAADVKPGPGEKRKKMKLPEEYVCTDCGTLNSPEWRKGPGGPKTLCNACGLRWAKKEKKTPNSTQPP